MASSVCGEGPDLYFQGGILLLCLLEGTIAVSSRGRTVEVDMGPVTTFQPFYKVTNPIREGRVLVTQSPLEVPTS
jgi:hypothetical protein